MKTILNCLLTLTIQPQKPAQTHVRDPASTHPNSGFQHVSGVDYRNLRWIYFLDPPRGRDKTVLSPFLGVQERTLMRNLNVRGDAACGFSHPELQCRAITRGAPAAVSIYHVMQSISHIRILMIYTYIYIYVYTPYTTDRMPYTIQSILNTIYHIASFCSGGL